MQNFVETHLKQGTLERYGLPDISPPVPAAAPQSTLLDDGDLPIALMLHGLQQRRPSDSRSSPRWIGLLSRWRPTTPARSFQPQATRLQIDSMDLGAKLVTIQRCNTLIATIIALKGG